MNSAGDERASIAAEWASEASRGNRTPAGEGDGITATELTTGFSGGQGWMARLSSSRLAQRVNAVSDLRARRLAAFVLLVGFVLVVVAQWKPWFSLDAMSSDFGDSERAIRSIGALDALYTLAVPYYLGWTLIAMAAGMAIFGRKRLRRSAAGVAAGALVGQTLVVLATWHDDGVGIYRAMTSPDGVLHSSRRSGIYFVIAALVVVAIALVIAVRGRIIPALDDDDVTPAAPPVTDEPHTPSPRKGVRAGTPWVDRGEDLGEDGAVAPVLGDVSAIGNGYASRPQPSDHTMYMRPETSRVNSPR